jgi:hypothetical protein
MIANGFDVAVIEHHVSSSYSGFTNVYSQARINYYNISGIPNSFFDGVLNVLGGSTGTYNQFLSKYNQRIAIPSDFTLALNGFNEGLDYVVNASMENVEPYAGTNLVLQFVITESHLMNGGSEYNYVNRSMVPNANGTPVSFSTGSKESVMLEFSLNSGWVIENCEFVAFIQDNATKEILQATRVAIPDLMPMYYDNAGCMDIHMVSVTNCSGDVSPHVNLINEGAQNLTSVEINYRVNNETLNTFLWSGNLNYGASELVELPAINFTLQNNNDLMIYTTNPNGNPDEDTSNDTITTTFISAMEVIPNVYVFIKLDDNPEETTWECKNSAGEVLFSGGPYVNAQEFVKDTLYLSENDCYTFNIYDSGGDGLVGGTSGFTLRQSDFSLIYQNNDFENTEELVQFAVNQTRIPAADEIAEFNVYPNPFGDHTYVSFYLSENGSVDLTVYNLIGKVVYSSNQIPVETGYNKLKIDTQEFAPGIYFIKLKAENKIFTRKISSY